jgi:hypothetical protein
MIFSLKLMSLLLIFNTILFSFVVLTGCYFAVDETSFWVYNRWVPFFGRKFPLDEIRKVKLSYVSQAGPTLTLIFHNGKKKASVVEKSICMNLEN